MEAGGPLGIGRRGDLVEVPLFRLGERGEVQARPFEVVDEGSGQGFDVVPQVVAQEPHALVFTVAA